VKAFKASIESTGLYELRFRPKTGCAFFASQAVTLFHFGKRFHNAFTASDQALKRADPSRTAYEELNAARITRYVRLVFLCDPNICRNAADRAWKHLLFRKHRELRTIIPTQIILTPVFLATSRGEGKWARIRLSTSA
jgi:hypothetical protein